MVGSSCICYLNTDAFGPSQLTEQGNMCVLTQLWAPLVAQSIKNPLRMQKTWVWSLGRETPEVGNGNSLQYSCLKNSMDRGTWWATVHGVAKSWTQPRDEHLSSVYIHKHFRREPCVFILTNHEDILMSASLIHYHVGHSGLLPVLVCKLPLQLWKAQHLLCIIHWLSYFQYQKC